MSVITKDLGVATAYGYAKSKGYTGTEEEFAELMASYADVAQQAEAAAQDAEDAKDAAITAKTAAQTAQTAAESAQTAAAGSAQTASTKASEASNSAQTAAGSATAAGDSATAAADSAETAQTAAQTATTKASEASSSASAASTAKTGAETARTGAQTAQANAEAAASSVSASAAQIEQNTEEIGAIKNDLNQFPNGTYPNMSVGNADQLTATVGIEDNAPYLFRTSGGSNDIGDREDVRKIVGGTIANNQMVNNGNFGTSSSWFEYACTYTFADGVATVTPTESLSRIFQTRSVVLGHKYIMVATFKGTSGEGSAMLSWYGGVNVFVPFTGTWQTVSQIINNTFQTSDVWQLHYGSSSNSNKVPYMIKDAMCFDLTAMFGATIADYIYSLETATVGAGVAWLKKHFPAQFDAGYQAYDAGTLKSVSGLTEHKMTGFNQWNEEWELGVYDINTGAKIDNSSNIRNKNLIRILPNTQYCWNNTVSDVIRWVFFDANKEYLSSNSTSHSSPYVFTTPANACYMAFYYGATSYSGTLCINLHWDGEKDGTYEPYKTWSYALDDSVTLRGIPKVDASGNLYYDGDEYLPDGTVNRRYGIVDLGTCDWIAEHEYTAGQFRFSVRYWPVYPMYNANFICSAYVSAGLKGYSNVPDKSITFTNGEGANLIVRIHDSSYANADASTFKTAMNGVYLVYELATPTTETADPYQETQIVDDFGTEEYVLADGAFPVPVGHVTMYQNNLRAKLEMSPDSPDGDGLYVVQQESGENTYVPLASTATIQDILTRLTALENA